MENIAPTKANLISAEGSLEFSKKGFELLDKKRNVLIREMMSYIDRASELKKNISSIFIKAYKDLEKANITMGAATVSGIFNAIPETVDYSILFKSVMGVEVPHIKYDRQNIISSYSFNGSNPCIDMAYESFNQVKYLIYELAEVENAVYKLAVEVKKTQKRANALQNIQIPKFIEVVKVIREVLEEKEREDFFRLKVVKKKKNKQR